MNVDVKVNVLVALADIPGLTVGNAAVVSWSLAHRPEFVSTCTKIFKVEISSGAGEEITRDIPDVSDSELKNLDENGIVKQGVQIAYNDILIGRVVPKKEEDLTAKDRLLDAIFGEKGRSYVKNISVRWPHQDPSRVVRAFLTEDKKSAIVEVLIKRVLSVGDVLETERGDKVTVAAIFPDKKMPYPKLLDRTVEIRAEMVLNLALTNSFIPGEVKFKKVPLLLEEKIHGRSFGPYGSVTFVSLSDESGWQKGAALSEEDLRCFTTNGAKNIIQELLTSRSSGNKSAPRLYEAILRGEKLPEPRTPETLKALFVTLRALAIKTELSATKIEFGFADTKDVDSWSWGEVKRDKFIDGRSLKPFPDGLFSEKIFGPATDWHCGCGKYKRVRHKGIICEKCGVEVARAKIRGERMGHISLASQVMHPLRREQELRAIPVLPPNFRPIVGWNPIEEIHELNDFYRRVILRNNMLKRLQELNAPEIISKKEREMLQEAVDKLFYILLEFCQKLHSSFWWNRMVDFSGQGILIPDPALRPDECELPIPLAMEIFKPLVMRQLVKKGFAHNFRAAKKIIDRKRPETVEVLAELAPKYLVLACYRTETSSLVPRSKMHAFWVHLTDKEAIGLAPDACRRFGAQIKGEMIDVFLPVFPAAQKEAKNFLFPAIDFPRYEPRFSDQLAPIQSALLFDGEPIKAFLVGLRDHLQKTGKTERALPLSGIDKLMLLPEFEDLPESEPKLFLEFESSDG